MSVLAEGARDNRATQKKECHQSDGHNSGEADEVFDVLEQVIFLQPCCRADLRAKMRNALG